MPPRSSVLSLANVFILAEQSRYRQYNLRYLNRRFWITGFQKFIMKITMAAAKPCTESITLQTCTNVYITDMAKQRMGDVFIFTRILVPPYFQLLFRVTLLGLPASKYSDTQ